MIGGIVGAVVGVIVVIIVVIYVVKCRGKKQEKIEGKLSNHPKFESVFQFSSLFYILRLEVSITIFQVHKSILINVYV